MSELILNLHCELSFYIKEIQNFPILSAQEEIALANKIESEGCKESARTMVLSHLRLVVKIAAHYRSYGIAMLDMISEGNIGLMHAVTKFKNNMGCRFATYASWWIKSHIQDLILRSWSLLKISGSALKKKLFYSKNRFLSEIARLESNSDCIAPERLENIQANNVLNAQCTDSHTYMDNNMKYMIELDRSSSDDSHSMSETIGDNALTREMTLINFEEESRSKIILRIALNNLNQRERDIILSRYSKIGKTLASLAEKYQISTERIRQIENNAIKKVKKFAATLNDLSIKELHSILTESSSKLI